MITACRSKVASFILGAVFATFGTLAAAEGRSYLIDLRSRMATELGSLGGPSTIPRAINDAGQVVGRSNTSDGESHGFITGPDGQGMRDLGTLGRLYSEAYGIDDAGRVVGWSYSHLDTGQAFFTGPNGVGMRDIGTLGGDRSIAYGINDAGQVVGESYTAAGTSHAFITGPDGIGMRDLGTLVSGDLNAASDISTASAINASGRVVGYSFMRGAFIISADGEGIREFSSFRIPSGINVAGQVLGDLIISDSISHAFITGADGMGMRDLGTLGGNHSWASGINDAGQVVGNSSTSEGAPHAFITGLNGGGMLDLNSLVDLPDGVVLTEAMDINNVGQVIAIGIIPEPESYAMFLAGLGLIGLIARRGRLFA